MNKLIHSANGKKAVAIAANSQAGPFTAYLYVNCNPTFRTPNGLGDITMMRKKAARLQTIEAWAQTVLAA